MGLKEFRDSTGVVWQVWSVTAEVLDKRTAAEDYMRDWQDGWLCFEHPGARKRLAQFPPDWEELPDTALESLLGQAQLVKPRRSGSVSGEFPTMPASASTSQPVQTDRAVDPASSSGLADQDPDSSALRRRQTDPSDRDQQANPPR